MSGFEEFMRPVRRLGILRTLKKAAGRRLNCRLIARALKARGNSAPVDQVRTEVYWLQEQGLVTIETHSEGGEEFVIATLTQRGAEYLDGTISVPGIADPFEV